MLSLKKRAICNHGDHENIMVIAQLINEKKENCIPHSACKKCFISEVGQKDTEFLEKYFNVGGMKDEIN